jgi:hypothetical protein
MRLFGAAALVPSAVLAASTAYADEDGQRFTLSWDGRVRSYLLYAPPNAGGKLPLVIALHGASQDAASFAAETQFAPPPACDGRRLADGSGSGPGRLSWVPLCCGVGAAERSTTRLHRR